MVELIPGLELGARFVLIRRLGSGGTSTVWLADDRDSGQRVALKILDTKGSHPFSEGTALTGSGLSSLKGCDPSYFVPVLDVLEADGRTLIAMEFQPGGDLGQFRGRSFESWARLVDETAAGLEVLHGQGLVHRDLKCGNVLIDAAGHARLADFGLTTEAGLPSAPGGSPYNASPQQLRGDAAHPADDLYALGALLYELIAGHPPYYPEVTRDRVLHEPVPALVPRGVVPAGVRELALRLLAKSPRERPASAADVRARLTAAATEADGHVEPLAPLPSSDVAHLSLGRRLLPLALAAAALVAIAAIVWLPGQLNSGSSRIAEEARADAARASAENQARQQTEAERKVARDAAGVVRVAYETAFKALDARAAARWATADFARARDGGARAADRYAAEQFAEAAGAWQKATETLATIEKQLPGALKDAVQRGQASLANADTAAAREAFGLALAIEPQNAAAKAGIDRAGKLDQALVVVDTALADERAGRPDAAEQGYRRALTLEPQLKPATEGLARLAAQRSGNAYAAAMSRGFADLAAGRHDSARRSFQSALTLRPGSVEARDAIAALDQGQRASALQLLEARARAAEAEERWDEALAAWREAAGLEASLASAREGIARTTPRAELQRRIETLNREPERLWDPAGRAEARNLLATAAAAGNPRQRLAAAARELDRIAAAAQTPVRLRLQSDGVTQVTIYRIGQYGTFSERDVELLPGRYTVVGTRNGFRDVRREVILPPGASASAVVVRCEEPI